MTVDPRNAILEIQNLSVVFALGSGQQVRAVNGVSFQLFSRETLGVVGESGSGKSVTALSVLQLLPTPPARIAGDGILFEDKNLLHLPESQVRRLRGNRISMIFQEPMTCLNPVLTIGFQIAEAIRVHRDCSRHEAMEEAAEMLDRVRIPAPHQRIREYPHQLSGGMRQRAMIAMALACKPKVLLADEPTTALDVTIQAQIAELLAEMREAYEMGVVLISHDMGLIAETCDRVVVMYADQTVEEGPVEDLFAEPLHPYTRGLLHSVPRLRTRPDQEKAARLETIPGTAPNPALLPAGCPFQSRCPHVMTKCADEMPPLIRIDTDRAARCWLHA